MVRQLARLVDLFLKSGDGGRVVSIGNATVATQRFAKLGLAVEVGLQLCRNGNPGSEPAVLFLPVTPLRSHPKTLFWHLLWHQKGH